MVVILFRNKRLGIISVLEHIKKEMTYKADYDKICMIDKEVYWNFQLP